MSSNSPFSDIPSHKPDEAWVKLKKKVIKKEAYSLPLDTPIYPDKVRFVCISDTHSRLFKMKEKLPAGDVLLHAGDFTSVGSSKDVEEFNTFLGTLPHPFKVVIAGNHELSFDPKNGRRHKTESFRPTDILNNCTYLQDSDTVVYGYKIYGSPWTPRFHDWAFNEDRGERIMQRWNAIPSDTDILITHGPPIGYGDRVVGNYHAGCVDLLNTIQTRVRPKVHLFGHIHEGYGMWTDETTTFINASVCDVHYRPVNAPALFDLPLLPGQVKRPLSANSSDGSLR